jgi:hypothetical protein
MAATAATNVMKFFRRIPSSSVKNCTLRAAPGTAQRGRHGRGLVCLTSVSGGGIGGLVQSRMHRDGQEVNGGRC